MGDFLFIHSSQICPPFRLYNLYLDDFESPAKVYSIYHFFNWRANMKHHKKKRWAWSGRDGVGCQYVVVNLWKPQLNEALKLPFSSGFFTFHIEITAIDLMLKIYQLICYGLLSEHKYIWLNYDSIQFINNKKIFT